MLLAAPIALSSCSLDERRLSTAASSLEPEALAADPTRSPAAAGVSAVGAPAAGEASGVQTLPPTPAGGCSAGYHPCGPSCLPNDSPESCGSSCSPCSSPPGVVATCDGTSCGFECAPGSEEVCRVRAVAIGLGAVHSCAVLGDTTVRCWGSNNAGQVGDGSLTTIVSSPATVQGLVGARAVVAGDQHSCALMNDGSVSCWGANGAGQLGIGTTSLGSLTPVRVLGLAGAVALGAGAQHTCAILVDDTVRCWGGNDSGELGSGTPGGDGSAPRVVVGLSGSPSQIALTSTGSCVLLVGGNVDCWGYIPQLGVGAYATLSLPRSVAAVPQTLDLQNVVQLGAGPSSVCRAYSDGTVSCGGFGDGTADAGAAMPAIVQGLTGKRGARFGIGSQHICMLDDSGGISCWGSNYYGQVGDASDPSYHSSAYSVPGLNDIIALATGGSHNCVIGADGSVSCWGTNGTAELGIGDEASQSVVPTRVQRW